MTPTHKQKIQMMKSDDLQKKAFYKQCSLVVDLMVLLSMIQSLGYSLGIFVRLMIDCATCIEIPGSNGCLGSSTGTS